MRKKPANRSAEISGVWLDKENRKDLKDFIAFCRAGSFRLY